MQNNCFSLFINNQFMFKETISELKEISYKLFSFKFDHLNKVLLYIC